MTNLSLDTTRALRARTERVVDPGDLVDHLGSGGFAWLEGEHGFVTAGVAATVAPEDARGALRAIEHHRDANAPAGAGPRAVGALPFAGSGRLVVPSRVVGRDRDGRAWQTIVHGSDPNDRLGVAQPAPTCFAVRPRLDREQWCDMVDAALTEIAEGMYGKVVLARDVVVEADAPFDVRTTLRILRDTQPGCTTYADGGFVGASAELLVQRTGARVISRPMAGTGDDPDRLLASAKDAREHRFVVDAVATALALRCKDLDVSGPHAVRLATITHLASTVTAQLRDDASDALALARALHPTPAVGGHPAAAALDAIRRLEPHDRGRYAGPCGWVDARGDGAFVVALRCAELDGSTARLHAGAGIVVGSDPDSEWVETQAKLAPMLRALVRP